MKGIRKINKLIFRFFINTNFQQWVLIWSEVVEFQTEEEDKQNQQMPILKRLSRYNCDIFSYIHSLKEELIQSSIKLFQKDLINQDLIVIPFHCQE